MSRRLLVVALLPLTVACESRARLATADSLAIEQTRLAIELAAQKDSLTRVVLDADAFISQIDRSYDPAAKPCPDLDDVRLPNPVDLSLFNWTCFLNEGEVRLQAAG